MQTEHAEELANLREQVDHLEKDLWAHKTESQNQQDHRLASRIARRARRFRWLWNWWRECREAMYGYPPSLRKACGDPYSYALKLTSGDVLEFTRAAFVSRKWVHIDTQESARGRDVRVDAIVWVRDTGDDQS